MGTCFHRRFYNRSTHHMIIWGVTALGHDGSISVIRDDQILFAAHSERYSRVKNDPDLNQEIVDEALTYGHPDEIVWYEKPYLKKSRQAWAGQWGEVFGNDTLPKQYMKQFFKQDIKMPKIRTVMHHESHAAAGAFTSPYDEAVVVVLDAIGEWNCCTTWLYKDKQLELIDKTNYPHSFGLFYSAFTQRCGLKPNEEEYIMMGMAAYGKPIYKDRIMNDFIDFDNLKLKKNVHVGIDPNYLKDSVHLPEKLEPGELNKLAYDNNMDIASSVQEIANDFIKEYIARAVYKTGQKNLVYMGGVALNCVTNTKLYDICDNIWIMPNPGDAGNSLGAALIRSAGHDFNLPWPVRRDNIIEWKGPFLGTEIKGDYPVNKIIKELETNKICGVANGRAEFGPRALGNRSLLADPRGDDIKDKVNEIKKRQKFRPFAPAILEEHVHKYFDIPTDKSPYMQFVAKARDKTIKEFPAIIHADGTSRVQTVSKEDNPGFRKLLETFYEKTGCPMLLNTSLNIRGEPLVNDKKDAEAFEERYKVKVFTGEN